MIDMKKVQIYYIDTPTAEAGEYALIETQERCVHDWNDSYHKEYRYLLQNIKTGQFATLKDISHLRPIGNGCINIKVNLRHKYSPDITDLLPEVFCEFLDQYNAWDNLAKNIKSDFLTGHAYRINLDKVKKSQYLSYLIKNFESYEYWTYLNTEWLCFLKEKGLL